MRSVQTAAATLTLALGLCAVAGPAAAQSRNVALDQFDGRWFEIARSPNDAQKDCR